ncbi:thioredoxin family protein [Aquimarina sp. TRL1]|uniref:thioredoxin family protein n=1 Tax=Aquimarina sp. (strain TRL1) TaxID=2736252 RepID=UPI0015890AB7|nr:thioredoxin family protein [Aquimarina sp. TRL1]QKX05774.1 thioredoxin family protein [Aquimarina sp. TRL1]
MKKNSTLVCLFLLSTSLLIGQETDWKSNFDESKKEAVENNKNIVLVFAGSDWCAPCIKLEKYILNTEEFIALATKDFVLIKADFPRKKKNQLSEEIQEQNRGLAEKYNKSNGFPLVVVLDPHGRKYGELGYKKVTPEMYLKELQALIPY